MPTGYRPMRAYLSDSVVQGWPEPETVLRRVREEAVQDVCPPVRNLGVDDWAWRKGQEYGTILVNLDLHRVLGLLPDRASESFF